MSGSRRLQPGPVHRLRLRVPELAQAMFGSRRSPTGPRSFGPGSLQISVPIWVAATRAPAKACLLAADLPTCLPFHGDAKVRPPLPSDRLIPLVALTFLLFAPSTAPPISARFFHHPL